MTDAPTGSTVPRRQLGRYLRDARGQARLTVKAASEALEWSEAKMWRIETGQTPMRSLDVEAMCRTYGVPTELTEALCGLAKETKSKGWWHAYGDVIPNGFDVYIGLEEAASELCWYESELVPGLFQTADYARTLIETDNPGVDPVEIDRRVTLRMARQSLLTRVTAAPNLVVVLNEAILRRPVGGPRVMADQLDRLLELSELPNISLHIMPFSAGVHYGIMSGPFVILRFPTTPVGKETEPATVYVDGFTGDLYLDRPGEIERYESAFNSILQLADDQDGSRTKDLLRAGMRELEQ